MRLNIYSDDLIEKIKSLHIVSGSNFPNARSVVSAYNNNSPAVGQLLTRRDASRQVTLAPVTAQGQQASKNKSITNSHCPKTSGKKCICIIGSSILNEFRTK